MAIFPSIKEPIGLKESTVGKTVSVNFENNYVQKRKLASRMRKKLTLTYLLDTTDYNTLETFFSENIGGSFTFTHPITTTAYSMSFVDDTLEVDYRNNNLIKVDINLEEV